ncbi:hypothetical protein TEA_019962 [Camellia sinensis var. sinensis]|uniref:Uncharacterized protein n=1 Tax=Camellia sinensis var. sinensis TaxID=542762 RepID=A0A4S4DXZ8_CAMSN|nr:hypothetical protein TEA_019962 [Camellia sinensis var. sinensis]
MAQRVVGLALGSLIQCLKWEKVSGMEWSGVEWGGGRGRETIDLIEGGWAYHAQTPEFQANLQIAIDLFVSKKRHGVTRGGGLRFKDSSGNLVFRNGSWQGFKRDNSEEVMIFRVERTLNALFRTELDVFPVGENGEESKSDFKMKGSPFHRSCTIYSGNSIMAQTSLMYKLGIQKVLVPRHRFRLTIFPGFVDHAFVFHLMLTLTQYGHSASEAASMVSVR